MADQETPTTEETGQPEDQSSENTTASTNQPVTVETTPEAKTPAAAKKPDSEASDHMIPKARFDEVNSELKKLRTEIEQGKKTAEAQQKAQEREQAKRDGDLQKQIELLTADLELERTKATEAETKAKNAEIASIRAKIAQKLKLAAEFVDRLRGENEEEIEEDAKKILEALPKIDPVTQTDGAVGRNDNAPTPGMSEADIREMAVRYGVTYEHLKQVLETQ